MKKKSVVNLSNLMVGSVGEFSDRNKQIDVLGRRRFIVVDRCLVWKRTEICLADKGHLRQRFEWDKFDPLVVYLGKGKFKTLIEIDVETDKELLEKHGWIVECQSPFEIRHSDGSFATGQAAEYLVMALREGWADEED